MDITLDSEGERSRLSAYANLVRAQNSLQDAKDGLYSLKSMLETKEKAFKNVKDNTNYSNDDERYQFHIAENDYMSAKSNYDAQQNVIVQAQLALESASKDYQAQSPVILAPGEGVISNITAVEGSKISNSVTSDRSIQTVASIKQPGTPILSLNLSEIDIPKVKVGQSVSIKLNSLPDIEFKGSVVGIGKIGQVTSGVTSYPVVVKFETENDNVFPNMNVSAKIITDTRSSVLLLPSAAITNSNGKKIVKVSRNGGPIEVEVSTGISDNTNIEVVSGLSEGDIVVLNTLPTKGFSTSSTTSNTTNSRSQRNNSGFNLFGIFGGQQRR